MSVVHVTTDKPTHCAANHHVRCKVLLCGNPGRAHDASQGIRGYADDSLVLVLMVQQGGYGPYLDSMP